MREPLTERFSSIFDALLRPKFLRSQYLRDNSWKAPEFEGRQQGHGSGTARRTWKAPEFEGRQQDCCVSSANPGSWKAPGRLAPVAPYPAQSNERQRIARSQNARSASSATQRCDSFAPSLIALRTPNTERPARYQDGNFLEGAPHETARIASGKIVDCGPRSFRTCP